MAEMTDNVYTFNIDENGEAVITGFDPVLASLKHAPYVIIPDKITDFESGKTFPVKQIQAFTRTDFVFGIPSGFTSNGIYTIVVEEGIRSIDQFAFCDCKDLTSLYLPKSIVSMPHKENDMFIGCEKNPVIRCPRGSTAEALAILYGYKYKNISPLKEVLHGDEER